jgi:8-oxo-dGTP pyrophosphatase MutT (NUDIX family)
MVPASRASAVLILVVPGDEDDEASVVLIERSRNSGTHRGHIAFPGGVLKQGESDVDAALRETQEEIGIPCEDVEVIGSLDMIPTLTGFLISPFVGLLQTRPAFVVDPVEVERVIVVPLVDLVRPDAHWYQAWNPEVPSSVLPFFTVDDAVGWGTTGVLLTRLLTAAAAGHRTEDS